MAINYVKTGTDALVGGAAGIFDQVIMNQDAKREIEFETKNPGKKLGAMQQLGTWYNYGVPLLAVLGMGFNVIRGDMATRIMTAGGQLAGRQIVYKMTRKNYRMTYIPTGGTGVIPAQWQRINKYNVTTPTEILV